MGRYSWGGWFMSYGRACVFSTVAVVTVLALPAEGQSVISTRSGVVHFFEGAVYLGDVPLAPHLGKFPRMAEGSELRTAQGRAEVLLTPGVSSAQASAAQSAWLGTISRTRVSNCWQDRLSLRNGLVVAHTWTGVLRCRHC